MQKMLRFVILLVDVREKYEQCFMKLKIERSTLNTKKILLALVIFGAGFGIYLRIVDGDKLKSDENKISKNMNYEVLDQNHNESIPLVKESVEVDQAAAKEEESLKDNSKDNTIDKVANEASNEESTNSSFDASIAVEETQNDLYLNDHLDSNLSDNNNKNQNTESEIYNLASIDATEIEAASFDLVSPETLESIKKEIENEFKNISISGYESSKEVELAKKQFLVNRLFEEQSKKVEETEIFQMQ